MQGLTLALALSLVTAAAVRAEPPLFEIKQRVETRIRADIAEAESLLHQNPPKAWSAFLKTRQRELRNLLSVVHRTPAENLAAVLVDLYFRSLTEPTPTKYPFGAARLEQHLEEYLKELGESAVGPLAAHYETAAPQVQETILRITGGLGAKDGLPMVRQGMTDELPRVRMAALEALRLIQGQDAREELYAFLNTEQDDTVLKDAIRQLRQLKDPRAIDICLTLIEGRRLPMTSLGGCLEGAAETVREEDLEQHVVLLLRALKEDSSTRFNALQLITRLTQWASVVQLAPILPELLAARYEEGRTVNLSGPPPEPADRPELPVWNAHNAGQVLQHVAAALSPEDIRGWLEEHRQAMLPRLYLEGLLSQHDAQAVVSLPGAFVFQVEVRDASGTVLSSGSVSLGVGQDAAFDVTAKTAGAFTYQCHTRLTLDRKEWRFLMERFLIDLKPYGVGFDAPIPFHGTCQIALEESRRQREVLTWSIHHVE